jgi:hypothetical protein
MQIQDALWAGQGTSMLSNIRTSEQGQAQVHSAPPTPRPHPPQLPRLLAWARGAHGAHKNKQDKL